MLPGQVEFEKRLRRLLAKHRAMARGYTMRMQPDGLIVAEPRRAVSPISIRSLVVFLAAFILFKGFVIASLGSDVYGERVQTLQQGNMIVMVGGLAMEADPLSRLFAAQIEPLFHSGSSDR
jgi:hypothetical protein